MVKEPREGSRTRKTKWWRKQERGGKGGKEDKRLKKKQGKGVEGGNEDGGGNKGRGGKV